MRSFKLFVLLVAFATTSSFAFAQGKTRKAAKPQQTISEEEAPPVKRKAPIHDQVTGTGYGMAGCGLGSIVFGPKPGKIQIVSATLNSTGYQTFAITSGTSNCDIPEMDQQAAVYIEVNKEIVMKDAARGSGETLSALSEILSCKDSALFGRKIQKNYERIFSEKNSTYESTRQIRNTIKSDAELASTCETLS